MKQFEKVVRTCGRLGLALAATAVIAGCATVYEVRPQAQQGQVQVFNQGVESLRSEKKHVVEAGTMQAMSRFDEPRYMVVFTNRGKNPVEFSPDNVSADVQGQIIRALSYEAQLQSIENRLRYYGYSVGVGRGPGVFYPGVFYTPGFGVRGHYGVGYGYSVFNPAFNDRLDVDQAYRNLDRLRQSGLKHRVVQPGETVRGEVTLAGRLPEGQVQFLNLLVDVDGERHSFEFGYRGRR
ncbi:MAG: hypothetical protein ACK4FF_13430 [Limnobacter sp.]|uniref:hypothetical protein n=1 Tax=Limnobacter sp. TaxID=2003368 RepID=UPI00391A6918